ncbi:hypothetical protein CWS18_27430, partial [Klebsiella pneumoniae]|uniref:hypothetical protein n=1 Tax=Klebsiella pneumoniae TaxID=573 RepID=UPI000CBCB485
PSTQQKFDLFNKASGKQKNPCGQRRAGADAYLLSSLPSVKLAGYRAPIARRQPTLKLLST